MDDKKATIIKEGLAEISGLLGDMLDGVEKDREDEKERPKEKPTIYYIERPDFLRKKTKT